MESKGRPGLGEMREESALNMFRQMDLKGKSKDDTQLKTVHQNTIPTIRAYDVSGGLVKKFSCKYRPSRTLSLKMVVRILLTSCIASGVDGRVVIWST